MMNPCVNDNNIQIQKWLHLPQYISAFHILFYLYRAEKSYLHSPRPLKKDVSLLPASVLLRSYRAAREALDCGETDTTTTFCSVAPACRVQMMHRWIHKVHPSYRDQKLLFVSTLLLCNTLKSSSWLCCVMRTLSAEVIQPLQARQSFSVIFAFCSFCFPPSCKHMAH